MREEGERERESTRLLLVIAQGLKKTSLSKRFENAIHNKSVHDDNNDNNAQAELSRRMYKRATAE